MAGEVLTHDEVNALLGIMSGVPCAKESRTEDSRAEESRAEESCKSTDGDCADSSIEIRISKGRMKMLKIMHDCFARAFSTRISSMLRSNVEVRLTTVDQMSYSEFLFGLDDPTCFNLIQAKNAGKSFSENIVLDISLTCAFSLLEGLLGGTAVSTMPRKRPLTAMENRLMSLVTNAFLSELEDTWEQLMFLDFKLIGTESSYRFIPFVESHENVIIICFEVVYQEVHGTMVLCIPCEVFNQITGDSE